MSIHPSDLSDCRDEELVARAQAGSPEAKIALVVRFSPLVSAGAARRSASADFDDLVQEGMLALLDAIDAFDESRNVPFRAFCGACVSNRIFSVLRRQNSSSRVPQSAVVPLDELSFMTGDALLDPQNIVVMMEERDDLLKLMGERLSPFESDVALLCVFGLSYSEISRRLSVKEKAVDNAVQRIRRKLRDSRPEQT